jgi:hypothetical protein
MPLIFRYAKASKSWCSVSRSTQAEGCPYQTGDVLHLLFLHLQVDEQHFGQGYPAILYGQTEDVAVNECMDQLGNMPMIEFSDHLFLMEAFDVLQPFDHHQSFSFSLRAKRPFGVVLCQGAQSDERAQAVQFDRVIEHSNSGLRGVGLIQGNVGGLGSL